MFLLWNLDPNASYCCITYARIWENAGQWKPVFLHILCSEVPNLFTQNLWNFLSIFHSWFLQVSLLGERCEHNSSLRKLKPRRRGIMCQSRNLRMAPETYFWFQWNCKRREARNSISNSEIHFPSDSVGSDCYEKQEVRFLARLLKCL